MCQKTGRNNQLIPKQEIMSQAAKHLLPANTIEKDYVINWLLAGIAHSKPLKDKWIFKGGTCLKKCYFEAYRFSEDLDFTITDNAHINSDFLAEEFSNISEWIYEHTGIDIPKEHICFERYENPRGNISITGKVAYKGPMQRRANMPTIKLDLADDELVICQPTLRNVHHPYSDMPTDDLKILTYSVEEIFAEKLRAFVERMRPRDLYDIIHLYNDKRWHLKKAAVFNVFKKKCEFKNIPMPSLESIENSTTKNDLIADWDNMLAHQINPLESYDHYWRQLPKLFDWLLSA